MGKYILKRILLLIPTTFVVCLIVFAMLRCIPGSAVDAMLYKYQSMGNTSATREDIEVMMGMDKPAVQQFFIWLGDAVRGDLGDSLFQNESVGHCILRQIGPSIELGIITLILQFLISIPVGVLCAAKQDSVADYVIRVFSLIMMSMPVFWLATIVLVYPAKLWGWAPTTEYYSFFTNPLKNLSIMIIPAILGAITTAGMQLRYVRTVTLDTMRMDYVRTARAKGVNGTKILFKHSLRNAMIPVITLIGGAVSMLVGGSVIMENLFSIPGIGNQVVVALSNRDYPIVQGCVLVFSIFTMVVNMIVDISYKWLDPRVKLD